MGLQYDNHSLSDRRSGKERRVRHSLHRQLLGTGQRTGVRRSADRRQLHPLDRYDTSLFGLLMLILVLSLADAFLTLELLRRGAVEVNPVMAYYLRLGPQAFVTVKYLLTALPLILLLFLKDRFADRPGFRHLLPCTVAASFGTVVLWELYLLLQFSA
ncbi:MAG: DUF5658 family protein [Thiocapsa sp.]|nr:DUF5658 family protein [Thiocapsa sp.]MCG6895892.1 DUF5658 family protein [Thiocapsa sp.]MCG6986456.1 DUF5658 family protein [Thiocapsa sp.]